MKLIIGLLTDKDFNQLEIIEGIHFEYDNSIEIDKVIRTVLLKGNKYYVMEGFNKNTKEPKRFYGKVENKVLFITEDFESDKWTEAYIIAETMSRSISTGHYSPSVDLFKELGGLTK